MKFVGITKRWFLTVVSIFVAILVAVSGLLFFLVRNYYYSVADMALESHSVAEVSSSFNLILDSTPGGFEDAGRTYIENFPDKDIMEVWIIDNSGEVLLSTSGFQVDNQKTVMPDFVAAINGEGSAKWTGRLPSGEKIMASTCTYNYPNGNIGGAVRFMISLEALDAQLARIMIMIIGACIVMFILLIISGTFFIRSIVLPVKDIGETAKRIAGGDLNARIDHYPYNDEIGELCTTINDMADKLSSSDRMKNDFISTVSHELRTPLTAIKGWGETLLQIDDTDPAMNKRGMEVIISEASRLNDMVEELLDFSRMSNGRMILKNDKIDILAELDEIVFSFKERSIKEGIDVVYNVPHVPAPMTGDASRIKQVFINILDNALKYSEHGAVITVFAEMPNPASIIISVADTGSGISPEDLPHVKEKFYKANTTVRGSGIGLAVADEIIRLHNGELNISSALGEGTTVRITLPIEPVDYENINSEEEGENTDNEQEKI